MKKKEILQSLGNEETILIKKSYLLTLLAKTKNMERKRILLMVIANGEDPIEKGPFLEISIGALKNIIPLIDSLPNHVYTFSPTYLHKIYRKMNFDEQTEGKERVSKKTCSNCLNRTCTFYKSSNNPVDCPRWHNPYLISEQFLLQRTFKNPQKNATINNKEG